MVAAELSQRYGVSEDTIRRDLRELADANLLKRVHGGALLISPTMGTYRIAPIHALTHLVTEAQVPADVLATYHQQGVHFITTHKEA